MKSATIFAATLLLCSFSDVSADTISKDHPVVRVISMLKGLREKAIAQGQDEEVQYSKFSYWCKTSTATVKKAIIEEKEALDEVQSELSSLEKEQISLDASISELTQQIADKMATGAKAESDRKAEEDLFTASNKNLGDTVDAVDIALAATSKAEASTEGMALAQTHIRSVLSFVSIKATTQQMRTLADFVEAPKGGASATGDLAAHVDTYDFKSENVIELLKSLKIKFQDERTKLITEETNSMNSFSLSELARNNAIDAAKKAKKADNEDLAQNGKQTAEQTSRQTNERADLKADTASRDATKKMCDDEKDEWEHRSDTRRQEIAAMDAAVDILGKAANVRTSAPGNPTLPSSPLAFVQVESSHALQPSDPKMKAVALIRQAGKETHSKALERLAVELGSHLNGHFKDINNAVQKMIFRLMNEQKEDDIHKLWCDKELSKSDAMKEDKEDKLDLHRANLKDEDSKVQELTDDIGNADEMITAMNKFMKDATDIRKTGKFENNLAIKDARDAQTALTDATSVLSDFYKDSGAVAKEAWEFLQKPADLGKNPAQWSSGYNAVADPSNQPGGIISVLEAVSSDFAMMEAETKAQESTDQKAYEDDMKANKIEKARRTQEREMKEAEKKRRVGKSNSLKSSIKDVSAQLDKTEQYIKDLQPACVNGDSSFADRKAARTKETAALREAQITFEDAFKAKPSSKGLKFMQIHSECHGMQCR